MSNHPLAEDYLRWLEPQIGGDESGRTYRTLLEIMSSTEFICQLIESVANDTNRIADGLALRVEFCRASHIRPDGLSDLGPCSFLEVLIGLSRRLSFNAGGEAPGWAWELLNNLGLHRMYDPMSRNRINKTHDILETVICRTYRPDGGGGFFPLIGADTDQAKIELWYQMSAYIDEMHPEYR